MTRPLLAIVILLAGCSSAEARAPHWGLTIHYDPRTGCQYLSQERTGITPRMDGNGRQVGCRR